MIAQVAYIGSKKSLTGPTLKFFVFFFLEFVTRALARADLIHQLSYD